MRSYGQYCPVARGSEVFAERWTPIIMRNVLFGCRTFNEIAAGAPGLSRALLARRLRELARAGLLEIVPKPGGRGSLYEPTAAGEALDLVLTALGEWADQWTDVRPEHSDPGVVLWAWGRVYLARDALPTGRVTVRFDFAQRGRATTTWLLVDDGDAELCAFDPGFGDDLAVTIHDPLAFARWHLGHLSWEAALRSGGLSVQGRADLRRALPGWNRRPEIGIAMRARRGLAPAAAHPAHGAAPARASRAAG